MLSTSKKLYLSVCVLENKMSKLNYYLTCSVALALL